MPTAIARITVTRDPHTGRWAASCNRCSWTVSAPSRSLIDRDSTAHQRDHVTADPRDQINAIGQVIGR